MKVLHAAHLPFWSGGVVQQMLWEQQAANSLGLDWESRVFLASGSSVPEANHPAHEVLIRHHSRSRVLDFRRAYYEWLVEATRGIDLLLLRYSAANPLQLMAIKAIACPVLLVHHTLEVPELAGTPGLAFKARAALESILGRPTLLAVQGGVTVTPEIAAYENGRVPDDRYSTYLYPNGISTSLPMPYRKLDPVPRILFVASRFFAWHGLDRLLNAARLSQAEFIVDIVGEVEPGDLANCKSDARFVHHGTRDQSYISHLAHGAWIGMTSLALDRKGMHQACTLKVREYLGAGLPVYSGHDDVFPEAFPYFFKGDGSIKSILDFAHRSKSYDPGAVAAASMPFINKSQILQRLFAELSNRFGVGFDS